MSVNDPLTSDSRTGQVEAAIEAAGEAANLVFFHQDYPSPTHRWRAHIADTADGELLIEVDSGLRRHDADRDSVNVRLAHRDGPGAPLRPVTPATTVVRGRPDARERLVAAVTRLADEGADAVTRCDCGGVMTVRHTGPRHTAFYGCSRFPECDNTAAVDGNPDCPRCGGAMIIRTSGDSEFWGCLGYPECDHTIDR